MRSTCQIMGACMGHTYHPTSWNLCEQKVARHKFNLVSRALGLGHTANEDKHMVGAVNMCKSLERIEYLHTFWTDLAAIELIAWKRTDGWAHTILSVQQLNGHAIVLQ